MIKIFIPIFLIFCFISALSANAQSKKDARDSSTTVIIFKTNTKKNTRNKRSSENNIIKIAPLGFISGRLPISYEKRITDFFSLQLTGGVTFRNYSRNFLKETFAGGNNYDSENTKYQIKALPTGVDDKTDPLYVFNSRKTNIGYMLSLQPRLYFDNDGLEGSFIALSADLYNYKYSIPGLVDNGFELKHTGTNKNESENIFDIMAIWGWQTLYDNLSLEYTVGVGLRNTTTNKYAAGKSSEGVFYEGFNKFNNNSLSVGLGFKVGYHF